MTPFIKKLNLAVSLFLVGFSGYSYSDMNSVCCDVNPSCVENSSCCPCPCPPCGNGFIGVEFLYWRPFQDGLDTCIPTESSDTVLADGRIISTFEGEGRDPRFEWRPGFRIGAGYEFACSNWDVGAFWTHFNSKAHRSLNDEDSFRWNIDLDVVDLLMAYRYECSSCFSLRPYAGIRVARLDQKVHRGLSPNATIFSTTDDTLVGIDNKHKFTGVGPLVGLEADIKVYQNFSLYMNGTVSWLYGRNDVRLTHSIATLDVIDYSRIRNKISSTLLAADASLGVRWQTCICSQELYVQLGYEHHRYFDYNRLCNSGDLSFDGVSLGLGIGF